MAIDPRELFKTFAREPAASEAAPFSGTKAQKVQRLQIGVFGLISMILVVALADIVVSRADQTEASVVSEADPVLAAEQSPKPRDPLADAGVVPELPAETGAPTPVAGAIPQATNAPLPPGVTAQ